MTTFANIKKESTGQLLDYFFDRVTFKLENQYDTTMDKKWIDSQIWEIGDELVCRGAIKWQVVEDFIDMIDATDLESIREIYGSQMVA